MGSVCFVSQVATKELLLRVSRVCGECYESFKEGEVIHYDMQSYRYLCQGCQEKLCEKMNALCEVEEEVGEGLFR